MLVTSLAELKSHLPRPVTMKNFRPNIVIGDSKAFDEVHAVMIVSYFFTTQSRLLTTLEKRASENIVEKGENAGKQHFLLSPKCFLPYQRYT